MPLTLLNSQLQILNVLLETIHLLFELLLVLVEVIPRLFLLGQTLLGVLQKATAASPSSSNDASSAATQASMSLI